MTHYSIYCPICGELSVARVDGEPTNLKDGYTYHQIDGYSYVHQEENPFGSYEVREDPLKEVDGLEQIVSVPPPNYDNEEKVMVEPHAWEKLDLGENAVIEITDGEEVCVQKAEKGHSADEGLRLLRIPDKIRTEYNFEPSERVKIRNPDTERKTGDSSE